MRIFFQQIASRLIAWWKWLASAVVIVVSPYLVGLIRDNLVSTWLDSAWKRIGGPKMVADVFGWIALHPLLSIGVAVLVYIFVAAMRSEHDVKQLAARAKSSAETGQEFAAQGPKERIVEPAPPSGPRAAAWCECDNEGAVLCVRNDGGMGVFYASIRVSGGPVHGLTGSEFVRWTHANETKTTIPRGVTCKARLATLEWPAHGSAQWHFLARNEDGVVGAHAAYTSCATSTPITRAPAVTISGQVIAEPDLVGGPVPYEITLVAFACLDHDAVEGRVEAVKRIIRDGAAYERSGDMSPETGDMGFARARLDEFLLKVLRPGLYNEWLGVQRDLIRNAMSAAQSREALARHLEDLADQLTAKLIDLNYDPPQSFAEILKSR